MADVEVSYRQILKIIWKWVELSVMELLIVGITVTFFAVYTTEGPPFGELRDPSAWTGKKSETADGER